jgi:hypothetical protein
MIAILGSGQWQIPLINLIEKKDQKIILISPQIDNQLKKHLFIEENLKNIDKILNKLSFFKNLKFAISDQSDIGIRVAAEINSKFNLNGLKSETASFFWEKYNFDKMLNVIDSKKCKNSKIINNIEEIYDYFNFHGSCVIKPVDGQSSRGVFKINNKKEIKSLFNLCVSESINSKIIVEPYISGTEHTLEAIVLNNVAKIIGVSKKSHMSFGIANSLNYSNLLLKKYEKKLTIFLNRITKYSGLKNGLLHAEFIENNGDIKFIEMGCRGGGTYISSHILPILNGYSPIEKVLNNQLNESNYERYPIYNFASLKFFQFKKKIKNRKKIIKEITSFSDEVYVCQIDIDEDQDPVKATDDRSRHGFVILRSMTEEGINYTTKAINKIIGYNAIS